MPGPSAGNANSSLVEAELYYLIAKFLGTGPCKEAFQALRREIEEHKLMPKRIDWLGNEHDRNFNDLERCYPHIADNHLLKICSRIGPILDKEYPSNIPGIQSLLGAGRQSLLRSKDSADHQEYIVHRLVTQQHGAPILPCASGLSSYPPNLTKVLVAREQSGPLKRQHTLSCKSYSKQQMYRRLLGHLSSVYCVLYDRTGRFIFTGADDLLVKIWSARDGRLLSTLRGHSAEITDMAVNYENTMLAASSCDKLIRVWCLQSLEPVAVLVGHTGMVTSLQFCPYSKGDKRYLISTGNDGCVCFWQWSTHSNVFNAKPLKFTERNRAGAQMVCSSFSPGGVFLATGSTDHHVRVYNILGINGPEKICEVESHTDRVDSLQFSSSSCRFITGSKDGTAMVWRFERQQWMSILLKMSTKLPGTPSEESDDSLNKQKLKVNMVGWSLDDSLVFTAVSDHSLKVWNSYTGQLKHVLLGHEDEVFVLESHPLDPRLLLSGGHDGRIVLWDLVTGHIIKSFLNTIEGQGHGAVFDCKFSPDGMMFASTDSHGHISIFGYGCNDHYKKVPEEQFFHTDYRPLIRDSNHYVLDEQTQCPPHLMPAPFLVDIDGNPYPPHLQRLVPGRENCNDAQLIPYVAASADGGAEILEPVRPPEGDPHRPTIDDMIERFQLEQNGGSARNTRSASHSDQGAGPSSGNDRGPLSPRLTGNRSQQSHSPGHSRVGMRRDGDIEGVRQSSGTWHSRGGNQNETPAAWLKRMVVKPLSPSVQKQDASRRQILADQELCHYNREKRRRPFSQSEVPKESGLVSKGSTKENQKRKKKTDQPSSAKHTMQTRGIRTTASGHLYGEEFEDPDEINLSPTDSSGSTTNNEVWYETSEHSESDSGDYSDWGEEAGVNRESSRQKSLRQKRRRSTDEATPAVSEDQDSPDSNAVNGIVAGPSSSSGHSSRPKQGEAVMNFRRRANGNAQELPDEFRPPEWLTSTIPSRTPYVPQIGDEVVYFHQGHNLYVQAVKRAKSYDVNLKNQPWKKLNLRDQEVLKIVGMKYELRPPRLCCLTVTILEPATGLKTGDVFNIVYHDMLDVIDFMVLKQTYDQAVSRHWKANDRFRSVIDNAWWLGSIQAQLPLHEEFPDSMFQCMLVLWENGESERMSPWDFERVDESRVPAEVGGSVEVTSEERRRLMYSPSIEEWPSCGRDSECTRLGRGLEKIMEMRIAEPFAAPVDLNTYPMYAMIVEYPVDLTTIKARLENRYYRRIASVKFDVSYILINARKFNEPGSYIVKNAKKVTELLFKFIDDWHCDDPQLIYQDMTESNQSRSAESDSEVEVGSCSSTVEEEVAERRSSRKRKMETSQQEQKKRLRLETQQYTSKSWRSDCMEFLRIITECEDSTPFRHPVSLNEYPDYRDIIDIPMDLSTVREKLSSNQYRSPVEFCKDMRLIFQNSRNYNTNKKSRIYSMTIRLSAMFEDQIRFIISDYRSAVKYEEKLRNNQFVSNRRRPVPTVGSGADAGPSPPTSRSSSRVSKSLHPSLRSSSTSAQQHPVHTTSASSVGQHLHNGHRSSGGSSTSTRVKTHHQESQSNSKHSSVHQKKETSGSSESRNHQQQQQRSSTSSSSTSSSCSSASVKIRSGSSGNSSSGLYSHSRRTGSSGHSSGLYSSRLSVTTVGSSASRHPSMVTRRQALREQNGRVHHQSHNHHTRKSSLLANSVAAASSARYNLKRILPHRSPNRHRRNRPFASFASAKTNGLVKKTNLVSEGDDDEENESGEEVAVTKKTHMSYSKVKLMKIKRAAVKKKDIVARPLTRSKSKVDEPSSSSRDSSTPESNTNSRRKRTVVNYKEVDEGEEEQSSNSSSSASTVGRSERITRHSHQAITESSDTSMEFRSSRKPSRRVHEEPKTHREVRWNLRNQSSNDDSEKGHDTTDNSDSSNSSRTLTESHVTSRSHRLQAGTHHKNQHSTSIYSSGSGSGSSSVSVSQGESHSSNTDEGGGSDDDSGVRRSSRTSTRNSTRATRSALHASSTDDSQEAPTPPPPPQPSGMHRSSKDLAGIETRSRGQRTVRYQEDSDFDYEAADSDGSVNGETLEGKPGAYSISSRGRRRKLIKHGRHLFMD